MMKVVCLICYIMENLNLKLEELLRCHISEGTTESLNKMLNHLVTCRVLVPAMKGPNPKQPMPCLLKNSKGETLLPIFTDMKQTSMAPKSQGIIHLPFVAANEIVAKSEGKIIGIAINPFTDNLILKAELIQKIQEIEEMKKKGIKQVQMTEAQYAVFERIQFEKNFLPKRFFADGKTFLEELDERKELYLDVLFEESYKNKRMYPYLEEDFSVMILNISETLMVARIELPNRDLGPEVSRRAFLAWDDKTQVAKYFLINVGENKGMRRLLEMTCDMQIINHGPAPVEGTELQRVVDLIQNHSKNGYTS